MALKFIITKLEDVDEPQRALYKKQGDGSFQLDVDGAVAEDEFVEVNTKLTEFRDNNRTLYRENEGFKTKFKDVDPEEYRNLKEVSKQGIKKPDDLRAAIAQAVSEAVNPLNDKVANIEKERDTARRELTNKERDDKLWDIGVKAGVREEAKQDYLRRAQGVFQYDNGRLVATDGDKPLYSKRRGKATDALSPEEWAVEHLVAEASFLFKDSGGGGSKPGGGGGNVNGNGGRIVQNDPFAIGNNLEDIASGKATVTSA